MANASFAQKVLDTLVVLAQDGSGEVTVTDLSDALMLQTTLEHKRMLNTLSDLKLSGRVARVRQGVYSPADRKRPAEIRAVMWRILRMRRSVTLEDLMEMAGASREYAAEWLYMLERRGVVRKHYQGGGNKPRLWQLLKDSVEMPEDTEKAEALKLLRRKKKQQITTALDDISEAMGRVRTILKEMED